MATQVLGAQIFDQISAEVLALEAEAARLRAASEENVPSLAWVASQACSAPECDAVTPGRAPTQWQWQWHEFIGCTFQTDYPGVSVEKTFGR